MWKLFGKCMIELAWGVAANVREELELNFMGGTSCSSSGSYVICVSLEGKRWLRVKLNGITRSIFQWYRFSHKCNQWRTQRKMENEINVTASEVIQELCKKKRKLDFIL